MANKKLPCGKVRYKSPSVAEMSLQYIKNEKMFRQMRGYYYCRGCKSWHHTCEIQSDEQMKKSLAMWVKDKEKYEKRQLKKQQKNDNT